VTALGEGDGRVGGLVGRGETGESKRVMCLVTGEKGGEPVDFCLRHSFRGMRDLRGMKGKREKDLTGRGGCWGLPYFFRNQTGGPREI